METTGKVKAVSNKNGRYGINMDGVWYNGNGDCPVNKFDEIKIEFEKNGLFNNVKNVTKISSNPTSNKFEEASSLKQASMMISYAKDLAVAGKIEVNEIDKFSRSLMKLHEELSKKEEPKEELKEEPKAEIEVVKM